MTSEFATIIHNLVLDSSMSAKDLAKAIGKPYSTLLREVNPYDSGAKLGAESLFQIMAVTGNYKPMEYMAEQLGMDLVINENFVPHVIPGSFAGLGQTNYMSDDGAVCPTCGNNKQHDIRR